MPVRRILSELGFKNVYVVPEQEMPDPDFTTLEYPNPEDPKAFTLALKLARKRMRTLSWPRIRMRTVSASMRWIRRAANTFPLPEICPVC